MPIGVLLVDDVPDVRRLVRIALRFRGGFEVVGEASTGHEAVELAARLRPDVVVLDLGLPDLAGRDVLTRVRESSPASKVVVFSGADPLDRAWFEEHVEGYLLKDTDLDYLVDLLESVTGDHGDEVVRDLPQDPASVRDARRLVRDTLATWKAEEIVDDAFLIVSELAANAINHAGSTYQVRLSRSQTTARIEVRDFGAGTPEPQPLSRTAEGGRGLLLVAALAASWGMESVGGGGKLVWAELPLPPDRSAGPLAGAAARH